MLDRELVMRARRLGQGYAAKVAVGTLPAHCIAFDGLGWWPRRDDPAGLLRGLAEPSITVKSRWKAYLSAKHGTKYRRRHVTFVFEELGGESNAAHKDLKRHGEACEVSETRGSEKEV
jgi:hypothetical protein